MEAGGDMKFRKKRKEYVIDLERIKTVADLKSILRIEVWLRSGRNRPKIVIKDVNDATVMLDVERLSTPQPDSRKE